MEERARHFQWRIGTGHLLLGLLRDGNGVPARLLAEYGIDLDRARRTAERLWRGSPIRDAPIEMDPSGRRAVELAVAAAERDGSRTVLPIHLLLGVLETEEGYGVKIVRSCGVSVEAIKHRIAALDNEFSGT